MGHEQFFNCPYCHETISMVLDTSVEGRQEYVEDCEVCCRPIQVEYDSDGNEVVSFESWGIQQG